MPYLCQPVPQGLHHDAAVVIAIILVGLTQLFNPKAGNSKQTQVVSDARMQGSNEVWEAVVGVCTGRVLLSLKTQALGREAISMAMAPEHSWEQNEYKP